MKLSQEERTNLLNNLEIKVIKNREEEWTDYLKSKYDNEKKFPFYICDLATVVKKYYQWIKNLPKVKPFYAIKCNNDPVVIKLLHKLGCGFDCASILEIEDLMSITNCKPEDIIYSNPCKFETHLEKAKNKNIKKSTFDSIEELEKIKRIYPDAEVILRIKTSDELSSIQLSKKFGADQTKWDSLLNKCNELKLNFIGVSFHVGTGSYDTSTFLKAIVNSAEVFKLAKEIGFNPYLLDIGGGFPGNDNAKPTFEEFTKQINTTIDEHFSNITNLEMIAEPGRYFAEESFYLATNVISTNLWEEEDKETDESEEAKKLDIILNKFKSKLHIEKEEFLWRPKYYINEGTTNSFSNCIFESKILTPNLIENHKDEKLYCSYIYGFSSTDYELISSEVMLPKLQKDEYIYYDCMGAYTISVGGGMFADGYEITDLIYYCWVENSLKDFKNDFDWKILLNN